LQKATTALLGSASSCRFYVSSTQRCEDIVAAPKFMVCRDDAFELYKYGLLNTFSVTLLPDNFAHDDILISNKDGTLSGYRDLTAWLGSEDSNTQMSPRIIPLKSRVDLGGSSRILAAETIRV
jgi:hypothetical protein